MSVEYIIYKYYPKVKKLILSIALLLSVTSLCSQSAYRNLTADDSPEQPYSVTLMARSYGDSIVLRWAADDPGFWLLASQEGWTITRTGGVAKNDYVTLNESRPIKPWSLQQLQRSSNPWAPAMAQALYGKSLVPAKLANSKASLASFVMQSNHEQGQRQTLAYILADLNPQMAEAAALRFVDRNVEKGATYQYTITTTLDRQLVPFQSTAILVTCNPFDSAAVAPVSAPQVSQLDSRRAVVSWPRTSHTAYFIERFNHSDSSWSTLSDIPVLNIANADQSAYGSSKLAALAKDNVLYIDSLPLGSQFSYRVRGVDAFSNRSGWKSSQPFAMSDRVPPASPRLLSVKADENSVVSLTFTPSSDADCRNLYVAYASSPAGPWAQISTALAPSATSFSDSLATTRAAGFYRLYAVDSASNSSYSNMVPSPVADLKAPGAPSKLSGKASALRVNVNGRPAPTGLAVVTLSWEPSASSDVLGYRLFSANQRDHQFIEVASANIYSTSFNDTVNIQTTTQNIYYYVVAVDNRYNYSVPSDTLQLQLPDIVAPSPCTLESLSQTSSSSVIRWNKSSSSDVDRYIVYSQPKNSSAWQYVSTIQASDVADAPYVSYTVASKDISQPCQYSIEAFDKAGNSSGRAALVSVIPSSVPQTPQVSISLSAKYNKKSAAINIQWSYSLAENHYGIIYRSVGSAQPEPISSFSPGETSFSDTDLPSSSANISYYIVLKLSSGATTTPSRQARVSFKP